jgi:hypothetical protein
VIAVIPLAKRYERDRKVTYTWKSQDLSIQRMGEQDLWAEQIELEFSHNAKRKQYEATIRRVVWQPSASGFMVTSFELFSPEYPSCTFTTQTVGRYGEKSFAEFERSVLADIDTHSANTPILGELLSRTLQY